MCASRKPNSFPTGMTSSTALYFTLQMSVEVCLCVFTFRLTKNVTSNNSSLFIKRARDLTMDYRSKSVLNVCGV